MSDRFWEVLVDIAGKAVIAMMLFSWAYVAVNGSSSSPSSRSEFYEGRR